MSPIKVRDLIKKRASLKCKVTLLLKKTSLHCEDGVDIVTENSLIAEVEELLTDIRKFDNDICDLYLGETGSQSGDEIDSSEELSEELNVELGKQADYNSEVKARLAQLKAKNSIKPQVKCAKMDGTNCELKLPILQCGNFSGEGGQNLEFGAFITQFNNVIGLRSNISDSTKFTYLKTYLSGYAQKVIAHLQVTDGSYKVALELLEKEFLNVDAIVEDLFSKFLSLKPKHDSSYLPTKLYINDVRCILSDLEHYDVDLLSNQACIKFISHIVLSNLTPTFRQELVRKVGSNYPTLEMIFEHYVEVIRTICIQSDVTPETNTSYREKAGYSGIKSIASPTSTYNASDKRNVDYKKVCKLCLRDGHHSSHDDVPKIRGSRISYKEM